MLTRDACAVEEAWPRQEFNQMLGWGWSKIIGKKLLPLELVVEDNLRDRQRDSFVGTNLSQSAKTAMIQNGDMAEAYWCRLLCQLYLVSCNCILWMVYGRQFDNSWNICWKQFYRPGSIETPGVPLTGHSYAQLKGILSLLIAGCCRTGALAERATSVWATIDIES